MPRPPDIPAVDVDLLGAGAPSQLRARSTGCCPPATVSTALLAECRRGPLPGQPQAALLPKGLRTGDTRLHAMDALSEVAMSSISTLGGPIGGGGAPSRPDASSGDGSSLGMSSRCPGEQIPGARPSHCMHTAPHKPAWAPLVANQPLIPAACLSGLTRSFVCLCVCRGEDHALARPGPPQQGRRYTSGEEVALRPALSARSSAGALSLASARL